MNPKEVLKYCQDNSIQIVDFKFNDLPGLWQHFSIPVSELDEDIWKEGIGFDGSSIRGFQAINESDMLLMPDAGTAILDPMLEVPTLSIICDIYDPTSGKPYTRDPRFIARKAEAYLKTTGIADTSYWGPEMEFFIFDNVQFEQNEHTAFYNVDSVEGSWNTARAENIDSDGNPHNLGYKPRYKEGYFPVPPHDSLQDLRSRIILKMMETGIPIEVHHHEVATAGQCEIDMRFSTMVKMGDQMQWYKYIVKNMCRKDGKVATFMPKPLFKDNGSGMHVHQSLWKDGVNQFFDKDGYALLSQTATYYIGGLLKHADALMAICAPTTNSYKRLVPGYEAPVNLVYSARNRSASVRIPMYNANPKSKRLEFRCPDNTANGYLCLAAMMMAGLDGIQNRVDPGKPHDMNLYELPKTEAKKIRTVPSSLDAALDALEKDHDFLLQGGVFTKDVIEVWLDYKRTQEVDAIRLRPHPWEFHLYFDI
ncbi:type I glutamate--ammonia ligase [Dehalogenimonas alkenigignens]|uniref:Glutamine synthetase n=1 Tax=Dehalogenimonas alkenigignens TaxID=1217799 RepID=A0A0W0GIR1_9CHLR|nr:type I glutamate--ammonia ligase [Dehalogenimonas alkenigignens]KTB48418.1 L-glutamine synthetase [Dehalogenimonas alkenigignens]PVV85127.1 type I glutamate--ammonia ligase [Dehalogenimonas alkenigignens]